MSNTDDEPGRDLSVHEEVTGIDTPEGRDQLKEALKSMRDLAAQHTPSQGPDPNWRLTDEQKEVGLRGIQDARAAIRATESPTERLAREKKREHEQQENDPS